MGKMALGYGSEFHLLRWTGRHRNKFDNKIKQLLNIDNVTWLDFDFSNNTDEPDKELIGLSFLLYWHGTWLCTPTPPFLIFKRTQKRKSKL